MHCGSSILFFLRVRAKPGARGAVALVLRSGRRGQRLEWRGVGRRRKGGDQRQQLLLALAVALCNHLRRALAPSANDTERHRTSTRTSFSDGDTSQNSFSFT